MLALLVTFYRPTVVKRRPENQQIDEQKRLRPTRVPVSGPNHPEAHVPVEPTGWVCQVTQKVVSVVAIRVKGKERDPQL